MPQRFKALRRLAVGLATVGMVSMGAAVIAAPSSGASVTKTVVTFAEGPGASPNYIFPFTTLAHFSVANLSQFQEFMYRPMYWFGKGATPTINPKLSLAKMPKASNGNKTFTITLKTYKWSNGEKVTSTDVLFWMNIWHAKPTGYAGYFPGGLSMPTSVKAIKITSPTTFTLSFKRSFNPHWLLYNELSEITPLPKAWTRTSLTAAPGSAGCFNAPFGTNDTACKAVYIFLSEQSGYNPTKPTTKINALPTYATSPLWGVVDGPWKLHSFGATQPAVMVPNPTYSGPNKPKIKEFIEKPFTTSSAEFNALVNGTIDWGGLPATDVTSNATPPTKPSATLKPGKNNPRLASTYKIIPVYRWGMNYFPENFNSTGDTGNAGPIFRQLYFRQALQDLVTQTAYISHFFKGYGVPTYGPVPVWPHNSFASKYEEKNPYPYSPSKAKALLKSHGWKVVPNGVSTCVKPGTGAHNCGAGIKKGAKLAFTLQYTSGTKSETALMNAERGSWLQAGIKMSLNSATFNTVIGNAVPCHVKAGTSKTCKWQMENWGGGWIYSPDYYPSGTEIFETGAASNSGDFHTKTNDKLISQTEVGSATLTKYENLVAKKLAVIWQPEIVTAVELHKGLHHPPLSPLGDTTPATVFWK